MPQSQDLRATSRRRWSRALLPAVLLLFAALPLAAQTPNVAIETWNPPATVRSPYVRILDPATVLAGPAPDYFAEPEELSTDKSANAIYVRFDNNSLAVVPDGAVTVTAEYAAAAPNLDPGTLAATASGLPPAAWKSFGSYTMMLVIPPGAPAGYGLTSGSYPTSHEVGDPTRYRILCSVDCSEPMPTTFFLRVTLGYTAIPGEDASDEGDNVALSYYDRGIPPSDVVILHDVSGSMSGQLALAQQRAKMFVDLLNVGDRVGVVAFSTQFPGNVDIAKALGTPIADVQPTDGAITAAKAAIDSFSAGGLTPMGRGVQAAALTLAFAPSPAPNRAIVMLTDGKENQDPRLKDPPGYPILAALNSATPQIGLYPLWFGALSNWGLSLLGDVEDHVDQGKVVDQPTDDLKLAEAYLMIRGILTSDDVYDIHRGTTGDGYEGSIFVDPVTHELILATAWQSFDRELDVEVLPPGDQRWRLAGTLGGVVSRDEAYVVHRLSNPATGQWRYRLAKARPGEEYVLSALADQVDVLMQSSVDDGSVSAGEPLVIRARLARGGQGVPGAVVRARVEAPDRALGTILHTHRDQLRTPSEPGLGVDVPRAAGILGELQEILGSDELFEYSPNTVTLTDGGDGTYTGTFDDTRVAGTYQITIVAESAAGADADGFRREHRHTAVVSLGPVDADRSVVLTELTERIGTGGAALWRVTTIPADVYGNFANPDYAGSITVDATAGRWLGALRDNDDGSYTRYLELPQGESARVTVTAFGQKVEEREVAPGAAKRGRRSFSLHAGTSSPTGSFDRFFDPGPSAVLDVGFELKPRLTLLGFAGVHDFPRAAGSGSETVTQLSVDLRWRLSPARLALYLQGGGGAYHIFEDWEPGANLGLGLTFRASPTIDIEGGVDYHDVFLSGDDARFWQAHTGFSIHF